MSMQTHFRNPLLPAALLAAGLLLPALAGADGGTEVVMLHQGLPAGVSPQDNELGTRMALDKLAAMVESR